MDKLILALVVLTYLFSPNESRGQNPDLKGSINLRTEQCDVVVAGGSLSALAAALTAAREGSKTCLLEPTDWPGGQLTSEGVSPIDEAWHKMKNHDLARIARDPRNQNRELMAWMRKIGNPGDCWVSRFCASPERILNKLVWPAIRKEKNLRVFLNTVVKSARMGQSPNSGQPKIIESLQAIQRVSVSKAVSPRRFSESIRDWYSPKASPHFIKIGINFTGVGRAPIVIEGSEFGDVLMVSGASYAQGVESDEGAQGLESNQCGQAIVFPFVARAISGTNTQASQSAQRSFKSGSPLSFDLHKYSWMEVWSYRRIMNDPQNLINQYSLQNWYGGNDYDSRYLFVGNEELAKQRADWYGGVDVEALRAAEDRAYSFFDYLKANNPYFPKVDVALDYTNLGSATGLSKFPYVRDTRRSIGINNFTLKSDDLQSDVVEGDEGTVFKDRVAIGLYNFDIHYLDNCKYPRYVYDVGTQSAVPYSIPFAALTNRDVGNLIATGKNIAQTFLASSSTRVHPVEWATGVGAGVAASHMASSGVKATADLLGGSLRTIQQKIVHYQPLDWTLN